jgi:lipoate-protein ligase A
VTLPKTDIFNNMAVDEALLLSVNESSYGGTLRFYQTNKSSLSLGYFQSIDGLDLDFLRSKNIDYVRRITGGRAVLHGDDLTFSFTGNKSAPFFGSSTIKITNKFSGIIKRVLDKLNINADVIRKDNLNRGNNSKNIYCFNSFAKNEILAGGKKIVGYALKKRADSFLLQGSIPLRINEELFLNIVKSDSGLNDKVKFTCVNDCAKRTVDFNCLKTIFIDTLLEDGFKIKDEPLSFIEENNIRTLKELKYKNSTWNERPGEFTFKEAFLTGDEKGRKTKANG